MPSSSRMQGFRGACVREVRAIDWGRSTDIRPALDYVDFTAMSGRPMLILWNEKDLRALDQPSIRVGSTVALRSAKGSPRSAGVSCPRRCLDRKVPLFCILQSEVDERFPAGMRIRS